MSYQVLARKWRPRNFAKMVGQEATVRTLTNALNQDRLHHAYLFTGTRGVGKTTIARILAKCLNCEAGISATPCGQCSICQAIDAGQFVDLIEVDAASRTKVEDTRELLDNVQYAPSQGRFKIYLIDEVHMLSTHSFNALLKTLEEPPDHVKFLLATTDPQKLPVTVLSRCLQFHLKGIPAEIISQHLAKILAAEQLTGESEALTALANAANGSMRDALSLLDQAIAFGNGNVSIDTVRELLGTTANIDLYPFLDALINEDGIVLLQHVEKLALQGVNFPQVLIDFLLLLQKICIVQMITNDNDDDKLKYYAQQITAENLQLFYQIGLIGQRDLSYAPTPRSGFEMILLRMLSFLPKKEKIITGDAEPQKQKNKAKSTEKKISTTSANTETDWNTLVKTLNLNGMTKVLAENCVLKHLTKNNAHLQIDPKHASLANEKQTKQLQQVLQKQFSDDFQLKIDVCKLDTTSPAQQVEHKMTTALKDAKTALIEDPHVQSILQDFGGSLDENSIKIIKPQT